jgi:hypothetical protein
MSVSMRIVIMNGLPVQSGITNGDVIDLGPGGMRFQSELVFPVHVECVLDISLSLGQCDFRFKGRIVWGMEQSGGYHYGVCFLNHESSREEFSRRLYEWTLQERPIVRRWIQLYGLHSSKAIAESK